MGKSDPMTLHPFQEKFQLQLGTFTFYIFHDQTNSLILRPSTLNCDTKIQLFCSLKSLMRKRCPFKSDSGWP